MSEDKTIRVIKVSREGMGFYIENNLENAKCELEQDWENDGGKVIFEIQHMKQSEYDALPEFMGW